MRGQFGSGGRGEALKSWGIGLIGLSLALFLFESIYSLSSHTPLSLESSWLWLHVLLWSMAWMYYPLMVVAAIAGAALLLLGLASKD
jgi:hypothetical protein